MSNYNYATTGMYTSFYFSYSNGSTSTTWRTVAMPSPKKNNRELKHLLAKEENAVL